MFQSTPPAREATYDMAQYTLCIYVSIHASRTGGDPERFNPRPLSRSFNPRLPHGRRPYMEMPYGIFLVFQSTPPAREATPPITVDQLSSKFQSTPPAREATPCGRRQSQKGDVSIHASRTGGDRL